MSQQERKYLHIQSRTDTKQNWEDINPILLEREIGYEKDTGQYKFGDGNSLWTDLPYAHNIENGEGENNVQQLSSQAKGAYSHAEGYQTTTISDYSSTKGKNTIAGCKGYWYSSVDSITVDNKIYSRIKLTTLHNENMTEEWNDSLDKCEYQSGDIISIVADNKYYNCASIKSIERNIITLNENLEEVLVDGEPDYSYDDGFDGNIIYVIAKPDIGTVDLGIAATSEGGSVKNTEITAALGPFSHVEGRNNQAIGHYSHAEGRNNKASNVCAHVEGQNNNASGELSHAEGAYTEAIGSKSHAEGNSTIASGATSHAEGNDTEAIGISSHAEGWITHATNFASHSEGSNTWAQGEYSHAEGYNNQANKMASHVEGEGNIANGMRSHAEGIGNEANGNSSHVEGSDNIAEGNSSHAEGHETVAEGYYSHAEGCGTFAIGDIQHVQGKYNIKDERTDAYLGGKYAHIVGNGKSETKRSNAHTLDWNGNAWFANNILSQVPDSNLNCALSAPMYVGNFHMDWNASDILNNVWPIINLSLYDQYSEAVIEKTGTVGEIFNPNLFNITVGWDDNTINQYFESITEAGIQILSDGQIYIFNREVEDVDFWEQTLGVNITIYYTGGGAINVSNE